MCWTSTQWLDALDVLPALEERPALFFTWWLGLGDRDPVPPLPSTFTWSRTQTQSCRLTEKALFPANYILQDPKFYTAF